MMTFKISPRPPIANCFLETANSPLSHEAPDDFIWGVQLSEAARALIRGQTFTTIRGRVGVYDFAATGQQSLTRWLSALSSVEYRWCKWIRATEVIFDISSSWPSS
jgi:hypothetical protein